MKTILITGAAQGLGRAIAQQLATQQNQLILLNRCNNIDWDEIAKKHQEKQDKEKKQE